MSSYTLEYLADYLGASYRGDANYQVTKLKELKDADEESLVFYHNKKLERFLLDCKAGIILLKEEDAKNLKNNLIIVKDPYYAYAKISSLFDKVEAISGIAETAVLSEGVELGENIAIGHHVFIGKRVKLGKNVIIEAGCSIQDDVVIGDDSHLYPNVVIYHDVRIGKKVLIHSGTVIGSDGFGNANYQGNWKKIHQIGSVEIHDDVEIGSNTSIDRGAIGNTVIETGVRIDNLVQIAHNVRIGAHTAIAGCTGIAGSVEIGKYCLIAGGVGISGHLKIQDKVILTAMTGVAKSINESGVYSSGFPAFPHKRWWKLVAIFSRLDEFKKMLKKPSFSWWNKLKQKFFKRG